jgi:orotidine-5'-phosphate decarboxylase
MESIGLRGGEKPDNTEDFLVLTPGVGLDATSDGLGQQYRSPEVAILGCGCDVIIVGRGIYGKPGNMDIGEVQRQAERYREAGWNAYLKRLNSRGE